VRLDPVGNVLPPVADETTWKELAARPVQLASVAPGSECPITPTTQLSSATGAVAGSGPVYAVGNVISYGARTSDGIFPAKVLWVAAPDYPGPALIRGRQLDGPGGIFFSNSRRVTELRFELDTRARARARQTRAGAICRQRSTSRGLAATASSLTVPAGRAQL